MTEQSTDDRRTDDGRTEDDQQTPDTSPAAVGAAETPGAVTPGSAEPSDSAPGGAAEAAAVLSDGDVASEGSAALEAEGLAAGTRDEAHAEQTSAGPGEESGSADSDDSNDSDEPGSDVDSDEPGSDEDSGRRRRGARGADRRSQLEREGEVAADFLETLLDICDLDGDLDVDVDGDRAAVAIVDSDEGRVPRRLVGQDAHVLEALQELTRLAVQSETGERSRLMLDVAGHRAERRATLVGLAKEAIAEVERSGEPASLAPMTAFERKVVHDEVLSAGLHSESEGSEPRRYVVISRST